MEDIQGTDGGTEGHRYWVFNLLQVMETANSISCDYEAND